MRSYRALAPVWYVFVPLVYVHYLIVTAGILAGNDISDSTVDLIELIPKSHNAPVPYRTMNLSEQKCPHFCSEWCNVGYGTGILWYLWDCSMPLPAIWDVMTPMWPHCSDVYIIRFIIRITYVSSVEQPATKAYCYVIGKNLEINKETTSTTFFIHATRKQCILLGAKC